MDCFAVGPLLAPGIRTEEPCPGDGLGLEVVGYGLRHCLGGHGGIGELGVENTWFIGAKVQMLRKKSKFIRKIFLAGHV